MTLVVCFVTRLDCSGLFKALGSATIKLGPGLLMAAENQADETWKAEDAH
jgi:hypothetical protein